MLQVNTLNQFYLVYVPRSFCLGSLEATMKSRFWSVCHSLRLFCLFCMNTFILRIKRKGNWESLQVTGYDPRDMWGNSLTCEKKKYIYKQTSKQARLIWSESSVFFYWWQYIIKFGRPSLKNFANSWLPDFWHVIIELYNIMM